MEISANLAPSQMLRLLASIGRSAVAQSEVAAALIVNGEYDPGFVAAYGDARLDMDALSVLAKSALEIGHSALIGGVARKSGNDIRQAGAFILDAARAYQRAFDAANSVLVSIGNDFYCYSDVRRSMGFADQASRLRPQPSTLEMVASEWAGVQAGYLLCDAEALADALQPVTGFTPGLRHRYAVAS